MEVDIAQNKRSEKELNEEYVHFDEQLSRHYYILNAQNAWLSVFKTLLICNEGRNTSMAAHFIALVVVFGNTAHNVNTKQLP